MLSEVTPVSMRTELVFLPYDRDSEFDKETVRRLYVALSEPGRGSLFENLDLQSDPPTLSTRFDRGRRICEVSEDTVAIEEEGGESRLEDFIEVVKTVLSCLEDIQEDSSGFPLPLVAQKTSISGLATPHASGSSVRLLVGNTTRVFTKGNPFGRVPMFFGIRFTFPPKSVIDQATEEPVIGQEESGYSTESLDDDMVFVTFQTHEDANQVVIEVDARRHIGGRNIESLSEEAAPQIKAVQCFMENEAIAFLNQFDHAQAGEESGGENQSEGGKND